MNRQSYEIPSGIYDRRSIVRSELLDNTFRNGMGIRCRVVSVTKKKVRYSAHNNWDDLLRSDAMWDYGGVVEHMGLSNCA